MSDAIRERWLPVVGYEGYYEVSDLGRIWSLRAGKALKLGVANGYLMVLPQVSGVRRKLYVHRAVAAAFIGPCPDGQEVRHGPGGPTDNRVVNLAYGTSSENNYDIVEHGNHYWANRTQCKAGHEFSEKNSFWNGKQRICRACRSAHSVGWMRQHPAARSKRNARRRQRRAEYREANPLLRVTHCPAGHEYTPENTITTRAGYRRCRTCKNLASRESRLASKTYKA